MRINHNIAALNTYRQLTNNTAATSKSLEKLSSGLRINRAGDDAAGLAISEKMRSQIRGLNQATRNAQDGISLIQTAEGSLNEAQSILQRMRELAVQSASDTNTDSDRAELQKEVTQLREEFDRIAKQTEFNTMKLINGDISLALDRDPAISDLLAESTFVDISFSGLTAGTWTLTSDGDGYEMSNGTTTLVSTTHASGAGVIRFGGPNGESVVITVSETYASGDFDNANFVITGKSLKLQIGSNQGQNFEVSIGDMRIVGGTDKDITTLDTVDISTREGADNAITVIDAALSKVSNTRANLGAVQNRLEHTIANLGTSSENLTASESRIRDVDMAEEIMAYTKNNILTQAATAMLAQANMQPQNVLQLLQ